MTMTKTIQIADLLPWGPERRVNTKTGPKILRTAKPDERFSALWKVNRDALKAAGIGWGKDKADAWEVCWWANPPAEEIHKTEEMLEASRALDSEIDIPRPKGLEFYPFQRAGIAFATRLFGQGATGVLIADEMGLGKTLQAIGTINNNPEIKRALIVCPASLTINWYRECRKWLSRPMTVGVIDPKVFPSTDVVIINYEVCGKWRKRLALEWDIVVIDEIHRLKNPESKRCKDICGYAPSKSRAVKAFKEKNGPEPTEAEKLGMIQSYRVAQGKDPDEAKVEALVKRYRVENCREPSKEEVDHWTNVLTVNPIPATRRLGLTGTPICNRPKELFPVINWLQPGKFGTFFRFASRYCAAKKTDFGWNFNGASNLSELQVKLRTSVMIRRLKADVLTDLPAKRRQIIEIPSDDSDDLLSREKHHVAKWRDRLAALHARKEMAKVSDNQEEYQAAVAALRKGQNESFQDGARIAHEIALKKIPMVVEDVTEIIESGKKVILFAHHRDVMARYVEELKEFGAVYCDGNADKATRQRAVDWFNEDDRCRVIVGGLGPMGVGYTMVVSDTVYFAEFSWVPADMLQAEDRAHRIGQKGSVLIRLCSLQGSLDSVKLARLVKKMEICEKALDRKQTAQATTAQPPTEIHVGEEADQAIEEEEAVTVRREAVEKRAKSMTPDRIAAVQAGLLEILSGCDGAREQDNRGFGRYDAATGRALANLPAMNARQAVLGLGLVNKYRRQVSEWILRDCGLFREEPEEVP